MTCLDLPAKANTELGRSATTHPDLSRLAGRASDDAVPAGGLTIAFDARPLNPLTRHWGVGVFIDNVTGRLRRSSEFVGYSPYFQGAEKEGIRTWPSIPNCNWFMFEATMLLGIRGDLYWGTNDFLPQYTRMPSVVTIHDLLLVHYPNDQPRTRFLANRMLSSVKRATKVVAVSQTTADDLLSVCPQAKDKIEVIHMGYGHIGDRWPSTSAYREPIDQQDDKYVLMLGAHRPRKNLSLAINAVAILREKGINLRLVITGNVHHCFSEEMRRYAAFVERVGVLPPEELHLRLQHAVALLFPSKYEGFGFPALEAMAAGCPVLALDTPINREISGKGALLLPDEPREWSYAIERLNRPSTFRGEMQGRGSENVQRFSWDRTAATYAQLFREVK